MNKQATSEQAVAQPSPWSIQAVRNSRQFPPLKVVIYGVPGIGKTTFAATFADPILLRTEDGASAIDVPTFPQVARSFADVTAAIKTLGTCQHNFRTLIVDSLDWLEPLVWQRVFDTVPLSQGRVANSIEDYGYGKGYAHADGPWHLVQSYLDRLREKCRMNVILIAHAVPVTIDPPDSDPYQRYSLKLHKRAASIWTEWCDLLLFCQYATKVIAGRNEMEKAKAKGTGDRIIRTVERPAWQAKSRWPLPEDILVGKDETWAAFHEALHEASNGAYTNPQIINQEKHNA